MIKETYISDKRDLSICQSNVSLGSRIQKRPIHMLKETYISDKRDLSICQSNVSLGSPIHTRPIHMIKETYISDKRDLYICQSNVRPIHICQSNVSLGSHTYASRMSVSDLGAHTYDKRDVHIWQKRPIHMPVECQSRIAEARGVLFQSTPRVSECRGRVMRGGYEGGDCKSI